MLTPEAMNSRAALRVAARAGDLQVVQCFIANQAERVWLSEALWMAADKGHLEVVQALIPLVDPKHNDSEALREAVFRGYLSVVQALLPVSDPNARAGSCLTLAALHGHLDVLRVLIPVSDLKIENSEALRMAVGKKNVGALKLLLPGSDTEKAVKFMVDNKQWGGLDWLALTLCQMGGHDEQVEGWVAHHGEHLPLMAQQRLAESRQSKAGGHAMPGPATRSRLRG